MAIHDQHDDDTSASAAAPGLSATGASRRRFARTAGAGAGVIMTLASQPGMATTVCASPSQSLSLTHSFKSGAAPVCAGRLPSYWRGNTAWPAGIVRGTHSVAAQPATWNKPAVTAKPATGTFCKEVFYCATVAEYGNTTMLEMCDPCSFDSYEIGAHLVAAFLNVRAGLVTFMTEQDVRDIWYEIATTGVYKPSAGVVWQVSDVVTYLKKTMA